MHANTHFKRMLTSMLCLGVVLLLNGCKDFLDLKPVGSVDEDDFYQTLNDLQLGLNSTYEVLGTDTYQKTEWLFGEGCGDDAIRTVKMSPSSEAGLLVQFNFTPQNAWILNRWQINYRGIFRANWVISKAAELPDENINILDEQNYLPVIIGEAKFLRALYYFNLVKTYGGVPIKPERISVSGDEDNTIQPRSTREEVYRYIEQDLREALLLVEDRYNFDNFQKGKIDKGAVAALLMKVLAYQAKPGVQDRKWEQAQLIGEYIVERRRLTYREVLNYDQFYQTEFNPESWTDVVSRLRIQVDETTTEAEQLEVLIENCQNYSLSPSYELMWVDQGEFHPGSIFEIGHTELRETHYTVGTRWDADLGRGNSAGQLQPGNYFRDKAASDPRAAFLFAQGNSASLDYVCDELNTISGTQPDPIKSYCMKWYHPVCQRPTSGTGNSGRNFRVLRFAEVKLFYAEALNEMGNRQAAIDQIRELVERANLIDDRVRDGVSRNLNALQLDSYENTRDLIWEERRLEMAFEFDRFWEIVRQGKAAAYMQEFNSQAAAFGPLWRKNFQTGINEVFPIPQIEVDLSNGVMVQNPGY
ncbi:RagB/SusD family nutrient uptake outer membrane protein [Pontibacter sp. G13]|uniref:RagB/SusD family nutrient uptake outer membrane protein n=1 Tax=Pontibacter sp. G13 TaxID=3074898 RepID=UPI0028896492|nr:RagB/SusD family nutrient uptake outer membrane protein [Pontibacter sp. G13]WNJ20589.1 RagB/SusD family nutrient uptake outer membrane protein [Pontibacter sp. G13]